MRRSQPRLAVTSELAARLRAVQDALAVHVPGVDSASDIEIPKLDLADAVLAQARRQSLLPHKAKPVKVVSLVTKRSRRA